MLLFWAKTGKTSAYFLRFDKKKKKSRSGFDLVTSRGTKVAYRAKTHIFLHPKGIRLEFCILIVYIVLDMKPLYTCSNATRIAFCGKMHFCMPHRSCKAIFHSIEIVRFPLSIS